MSDLVETSEDIAVKLRLWDATKRELFRFADRYAKAAIPGKKLSPEQEDVLFAVGQKKYPLSLVVAIADNMGLDGTLPANVEEKLTMYRHKLRLFVPGR
jgi:hypothetical protein